MNTLVTFAAQSGATWKDTWPFGPGYAEGWLSTLLKFAFIGVIFLLIILFLRFAFGPGGWLREKEWDEPGGLDDPEDKPKRGRRDDKDTRGR